MTINIFIWQHGGWVLNGTIHSVSDIPAYVEELPCPWRVEAYKN